MKTTRGTSAGKIDLTLERSYKYISKVGMSLLIKGSLILVVWNWGKGIKSMAMNFGGFLLCPKVFSLREGPMIFYVTWLFIFLLLF